MSYNSVSYARIKSVEISGSNNLTPAFYNNTVRARYAYEINEGQADYSFKFVCVVSDEVLFDELLTSSGRTLSITSTRTANTDDVTWTLGNCRLISAPHKIQRDNVVEVEVSGWARTIDVTVHSTDGTGAEEY